MPAGEELSPSDRDRVDRATRLAESQSGLHFSVYLGLSGADPRRYAENLLSELDDPARSVLVLCDLEQRALEIVTGDQARRVLADLDARLAAASMQTSLAVGDVAGGLVSGLVQLGQAANRPRVLHLERTTG